MTIGQIARLAAASIVAATVATTSAHALFEPRIEDFEDTVREELTELGISQDDVVTLRVYPHYNRRDIVDRATGWVRIAQCPEGWIVVNMSAYAQVTYAYVHGQCNAVNLP